MRGSEGVKTEEHAKISMNVRNQASESVIMFVLTQLVLIDVIVGMVTDDYPVEGAKISTSVLKDLVHVEMINGVKTLMEVINALMIALWVWRKQDMVSVWIRTNVSLTGTIVLKEWFAKIRLEDTIAFVLLDSKLLVLFHLVKILTNVNQFLEFVSTAATTL